ncbi:protein required for normal CLN1 and CLN2 G1 cyclin expression [Coemansia brasiliensis]|uniref:Protein required for normal CLN1 and CLN2 G1 cyclin expression n=1 Tax=Coemansia brasiliensis TaxID=2650707 RepID=A0A9W8I796_9FUNG|nr:protein required for normal CLN1 and CLN2 G1 cyclin expression [Coemansia brasiliensis]
MALSEPRMIEVPIENSDDVLEINCSQLPEHASEICDILENEGAALRFYQLFAIEYYKQGQAEESIAALKRGLAHAKANDQTAKLPLLNFLASIYIQKAKRPLSSTNGASSRDMLLKMATALLTEAERISRTEPNTYLVKGQLAMTNRVPDSALVQFNNALRLEPQCLAALLGKARALFAKRQFQQALNIYQQVLILRPRGKPDPRIGIGMCLYKLGHTNDARRALRRSTEVDSSAAAPHIILATIELNEVKRRFDPRISREAADPEALASIVEGSAETLRRAMVHLQRAYELQPDNSAVLLLLADRFFCKSEIETAQKLAEKALITADTMAIQAEAHYQIARSHHAAKKFDMAFDAYSKCLSINDRHSLASYGLGQMQLQRTDMSSAEATFQRVLERHPKCVEVLRALGYLHARLPNTKAKALEYYEKEMQVLADEAAEHARGLSTIDWLDDANLFLEAGLLYEASSAKKARKAYLVAASILQREDSTGDHLPELWNNLGALSQLTGEENADVFSELNAAAEKCVRGLEKTRATFADKKSAQTSKAVNEVRRLENTLVTIKYNVARFYENCGLWQKAEQLYGEIVADIPAYVDARLRLAYIAFFYRGKSQDALLHISQAIEIDAKRPAAWLIRGNIELQCKNVQDARRAFEHVLKDIAKHDIYALCSLGNYYLAAGKSESSRAASEPASAAAKKAKELSNQNYKRSLEFFGKCLQLDEHCAAAAHGAAIAIAERGFANDARRLFQEVRDAATGGLGPLALCNPASELVFKVPKPGAADRDITLPSSSQLDDLRISCDVLLWSGVNTAHACVEIGNYRQAILAYEACIKRLHETTAALKATEDKQVADQFVVSALDNSKGKNAEDKSADQLVTLSDAERNERTRVERDLRLYLVRALYVHAKATKDVEVMRTALKEIRELCAISDISIPESELQNAMKSDGESSDKDAKEAANVDGDIEMAEPDEQPAGSNGSTAGDASKQPKKRVHLSPENGLVLFDLALVEQSVAQLAGDLSESQRLLADIDTAIQDVEHSTAIFMFLASWGKSMQKRRQKLLFSSRLAGERAGYGKSLATKLVRKRQEQEEFERQRQENVEQWRKQQQEEEIRKKQDQERLEAERREEEARILRETEERNAVIREQMAAAAKQAAEAEALASTDRPKKAKKRNTDDDGFISDNDDLHDQFNAVALSQGHELENGAERDLMHPVSKPRKEVKRKKHLARGGQSALRESSGNEVSDDAAPRKRRNIDSLDDGASARDEPQQASVGKYKTKAIVSDSDEDSE